MAQQAKAKTELFAQWSQGNLVVADQGQATGNRFWVDSNTGSDSTGYGRSPSAPFATLAYAFSSDVCTANNGDIIYVMEGHAETANAAAEIVMDIAGVRVVGLGSGATRPTITFTVTTADLDVTAADITIENILFYCNIDSLDAPIHVVGTDCKLINCEFRDAASNKEANIWLLASSAAHRLLIDGLAYNGLIAGDACTDVIQLNGGTGCVVRNSRFYGQVATGIVNMNANSYDVLVENCYFYNDAGALTLNVVDTGGSSTWAVHDCFDGKGGYGFSGSSTLAVAADDLSAVSSIATTTSTGVSTVNSIVTTVSAGVSANTSRLTASSTFQGTTNSIATTTSTGVSTVNSIVTTVSAAATGASAGVSTVNSIVTTVSAGVSTVNSIATTASAGVSTVNSIATTASAGVSAAHSTGLVTSTGVSAVNSIVTTVSAGVSANTSIVTTVSGGVSSANSTLAMMSTMLNTLSTAISTLTSLVLSVGA